MIPSVQDSWAISDFQFGLLFKFALCSLVTFVKRQKQLGFPSPGEISSSNTVFFLSLLVCERVCVVMMVGAVAQSQQTLYWQLSRPAHANLFGGQKTQLALWSYCSSCWGSFIWVGLQIRHANCFKCRSLLYLNVICNPLRERHTQNANKWYVRNSGVFLKSDWPPELPPQYLKM